MLRRRVAGPRPLCRALATNTAATTATSTSSFFSAVNNNCGNNPDHYLCATEHNDCGCFSFSHSGSGSIGCTSSSHSHAGLLSTTSALRYMYKPPGTSSNETSRLPWYHRTTPASGTHPSSSTTTSTTANTVSSSPSPLHLQDLSSILNSAAAEDPVASNATTNFPAANAASAPSPPTTSPSTASVNADTTTTSPSPPTVAAAATKTVTPSAAASKSTTAQTSATSPSYTATSAALASAAFNAAAAAGLASAASNNNNNNSNTAAAALRLNDAGALRLTPTRRMSALAGPTLDARVEDIVKVEETLASELTLPKVVQLLLDPQADGVERITMREFAAMQPRRQLVALGGKKEWLQWIEQSTYYQQAARLSAESPAQDLAALQQAGIQSLQQWLEHPQLVKVSARTRSALDTAVAQSVESYMGEVASVVNASNAVEAVLTQWVADVVGKFVLDSLQIPLDRASQVMWTARGDWMPADVVRGGAAGSVSSAAASASGGGSSSGANAATNRGVDVTGGGAPQSAESRMLSEMMLSGNPNSNRNTAAGGSPNASSSSVRPMLRPGEACTLDHYLRFVQKVVSSVRKDYVANHAAMGRSAGGRGDEQAEQEITERSHGVIAAALTQLLEQAILHQLPPELKPLHANGYLALDRVPGLLKRAGNLLQLRAVPVRFFVFHSSVDEAAAAAASAASAARGGGSSHGGHTATPNMLGLRNDAAGLSLPAPPHYPPGTFLTGSNQMDVPLGDWTGRPDPPSSTARESGGVVDDATEQEYLSVLHRLRRRVDTLAVTSLFEVVAQPERYGGNGFSAVEAIGLHQLFGPVKLLEDRLTTALHYPVAAADKPIHFVEAGPLSGKTALLEQLAERTTRPGDKVVLVRYGGSATPYLPDLDDHPVAFAARFWFRVALASCPYLIRTEELYSRAPRSVYWWGHEKNWSWERYQSLLQSARNAGAGHRQHQQHKSTAAATSTASAPAQLASILVDDVDRALGAMQLKWGDAAALSAAARAGQTSLSGGLSGGNGGLSGLGGVAGLGGQTASLPAATAAAQRAQQAEDDEAEDEEEDESGPQSSSSSGNNNKNASGHRSAASLMAAAAAVPSPSLEQQRQQVVSLWLATGKSVDEHLSSCFTQLSAAVGQVNLVFTGAAVSPLLLTHCAAPCRRYYLPLSGGVGLPSRLRVLPLLATLHALHLTHHLDMPGLLYEVLKNCPALTGKALELFWSHRVALMDLRTGVPRLTMGTGSAHPQLMQSYVPRELFAELPLYTSLLQNPRRTRRRLVELLQRQLSSPTGYLSTELDTVPQDVKDGLVLPHNLTSSQVHPFALFAIFSRQDAIDERVFNSEGQLLDGSEADAEAEAEAEAEEEEEEASEASLDGKGSSVSGKRSPNTNNNNSSSSNSSARDAVAAARVRSSTGVGSNERKVVRAWAEVWAEYRSVVSSLSTSPTRKRDAMRILLHGALLLRSAAVAGAQLELNLKVPSYGFPLLASETRVRSSKSSSSNNHAHHQRGDSMIRPATPESVRRATAAYKMFFSNAAPSHFPFRPMVGLNGGCDVVFVCGSTLALYDIVTTTAQLRQMVGRFAEALLGVLHVLERQVFPVDKVRAVQFVSVVSLDEPRLGSLGDSLTSGTGGGTTSSSSSHTNGSAGGGYGRRRGNAFVSGASTSSSMLGGLSVDVFNSSAPPTVPYYLDYEAIFDDNVMDRLRALQQSLGITKDFRTLNELIDEIERTHRVRVMQDVVSTPEEVESLFSPTLLQLVPDATVLPAYTSAVVSAADLMRQAMAGGGKSNNNSSSSSNSSNSGHVAGLGSAAAGAAGLAGGMAGRRAGEDHLNLNLDDDDDDDEADYVNLGEEEVIPGAELDDVASDLHLSRDGSGRGDAFVADHEHLHESAELLEAMMNDSLDIMSNSAARLQEQREQTARELRGDLVMEDRINYNAPAPSTNGTATGAAGPSAAGVTHAGGTPQPQGNGSSSAAQRRGGPNGGRPSAEDAEADALAWLHDIITPESLIAGLRGTAPGAGTPLANAVSNTNNASAPLPLSAIGDVAPGLTAPTQQQQQQQQQQGFASPLAAAVGAAGGMHLPNVNGPWTPNVTAPDGTENISAVFPRTAAKRDESSSSANDGGKGGHASGTVVAAAAAAGPQAGVDGEEGGGLTSPPRDTENGSEDNADDSNGGDDDDAGEEDEEEAELNLQKLFDAVGNRRRGGGGSKSAAATSASSRRARRGSRAAAGRRTQEEGKAKRGGSKAKSKATASSPSSSSSSSSSSSGGAKSRRSAASSAPSAASKKKAKSASSSGGKKKASFSKKKK